MSKIITISLSDNTLPILEKLKENPDFNFSGYIQKCLEEHNNLSNFNDPAFLQIEIQKLKDNRARELEQIDILETKLTNLVRELNEKEREEAENKVKEEKYKQEAINNFTDSIYVFYGLEMPKCLELAREYFEVKKEKTLFEFMGERGYTQIERGAN